MIFRYKIEIISDIEQKIRKLLVNIAVLPSWECGLKFLRCVQIGLSMSVAPFVGVWVEILEV